MKPVIAARQIAAQGKLMPATGIIGLSAVPGDQIESVLVRSGQQVSQGDVLVVMRSNQLRQIELEAAEAKLAEARNQLTATRTEARMGKQAAELKIEQAKLANTQAIKQLEIITSGQSQLDMLRSQVSRLERLRKNAITRDLIGQSDIELKQIDLERADQLYQQSVLTAKQAVQSSEVAIRLAEQASEAATESVQLAQNSTVIESLEKQIELLQAQLDLTRIVAPSDATVLAVSGSVGETAGMTPVLEIGDLSNMICIAEVHEADVSRLAVGDTATMNSAALPSTLKGTVVQVDALVGSPQMRIPNPLARTDFRAVPVRIKIEANQQAIAAALVQLQVDVTISPKLAAPR